jgi:GNAT superfamily N-acetyltransferase
MSASETTANPSGQTNDEPADRLLALLYRAAAGNPPPGDFTTTHLPSPSSPADAVLSFFGHHVVASNVDAHWLASWTDADPFAGSNIEFLAAMAGQLQTHPGIFDAVFAATGEGRTASDVDTIELVETPDRTHPRVVRALHYRDPATMRVLTTPAADALVLLGQGLAGRWEMAYEVEPSARGRGVGAALVTAARQLAPEGEPVYAQCSPGNVPSMRSFARDPQWRVIGSEVLFLRHKTALSTFDR